MEDLGEVPEEVVQAVGAVAVEAALIKAQLRHDRRIFRKRYLSCPQGALSSHPRAAVEVHERYRGEVRSLRVQAHLCERAFVTGYEAVVNGVRRRCKWGVACDGAGGFRLGLAP